MERAADETSRRLGALYLRFHAGEDTDAAAVRRTAVRRPYFLDRRPSSDQPEGSQEDY
jgi:hypothetical protein